MLSEVRRVGLFLFDGVDLLCTSGPACLLVSASRQLAQQGIPGYEVSYFSAAGGAIITKQGLVVETRPLAEIHAPVLDTIILPGGDSEEWRDPTIVAWLARHRGEVRRFAGISCGTFYLAYAGLLDGRSATTHWDECDLLEARFPDVKVVRDSIYVHDDQVWTSAGAASGLDVALAMIEEDHGRELAMIIAGRAVMMMKRPGSDPQLTPQLQAQTVEGPMAPLLKWIIEHPDADLRADALAQRANMSLRNFYRAFQEATGTSPADWVERVRLGIAKRLLEQTQERVDQVARKAGFLSDERMRRCFVRRLGFTPAAYRDRFAQPAPVSAVSANLSLLAEAFGAISGNLTPSSPASDQRASRP